MPAVTVDDVGALPKVGGVGGPDSVPRPVLSVTTAPAGFEGEGFPVRRAFAGVDRRYLDPFIHMDQMGEVEYAPGEPKGTPWHPHRGFETVTYMIDGTFQHQDSHRRRRAHHQRRHPVDDGRRRASCTSRRRPRTLVVSGGLFHGIQLWVNLPKADKMIAPALPGHRAGQVVLLSSPDGGALLRVIAGEVGGHAGPGSTHTPITMVHATRGPRAPSCDLPWRTRLQRPGLRAGRAGHGRRRQRPVRTGQLAVFGDGDAITVAADARQESRTPELDVLVLGGRPSGSRSHAYGPFVMNTKDEVAQAFEDYQAGRLGTIPADHIGS